MAQQIINVGAAPNDGTGDPIRTAYIKCNDNFSEIYEGGFAKILSGNSSVIIDGENGNILFSVGNSANLIVMTESGTSFSTGLNVDGNVYIDGNVVLTGNITYENLIDLVISDPLIYVGANNTGNVYDLGMVVSYDDGVYQHGGWVRDADDGVWKLFGNVIPEPTTVIDFTDAVYQPMLVGDISSGNITANGNVSISGNISSDINASGNVTTGGNISAVGGSIIATGNISAAQNITAGGNITTTGSIVASGNITVASMTVDNLNGILAATSGTLGIADPNSYAASNRTITWTAPQRGAITVTNTAIFDMSLTNNFSCTPTGNITLAWSNLAAGQSGTVLLDNTGNYAVTKDANTLCGNTFLSTVSTTGVYVIGYFTNGTTVYLTGSTALS